MKHTIWRLATLLLTSMASLNAAVAPGPKSPAAGAVIYSPHPQFLWQREADVMIDEVHRIQIARDQFFAEAVCDDGLKWCRALCR